MPGEDVLYVLSVAGHSEKQTELKMYLPCYLKHLLFTLYKCLHGKQRQIFFLIGYFFVRFAFFFYERRFK